MNNGDIGRTRSGKQSSERKSDVPGFLNLRWISFVLALFGPERLRMKSVCWKPRQPMESVSHVICLLVEVGAIVLPIGIIRIRRGENIQ